MGCDTICNALDQGQLCHFQAAKLNFLKITPELEQISKGVSLIKEGSPFFLSVTALDFPKVLGACRQRKGPAQRLVLSGLADRGEGFCCLGKPQRWRCGLRAWDG